MGLFRNVETAPLPKESLLWTLHAPGDFIDGYRVPAAYAPRHAAEIALRFPAWVRLLLRLRGLLLSPFDLKSQGMTSQDMASQEISSQDTGGDSIAIFPITHESAQEVVLGFDDHHLDFRISFFARDGYIHSGTWVRRHNRFGRLYLAAVMPFHILIAKQMLARLHRHAERPANRQASH
ncbi:DUF2867 domain-containing protein [Roseovarius nubinhibens]|uniref:DUF2867 domain-containing protein n=1 Tax=Roseovarius nubinhibens TaxID=314263 RepID=UPI001C086FBA|nr:DUF2867 domain-containing protein [Roseovarius nubinhibens]MBU3000367.1 DUF2867 domain-containing protein [Roseovarius nubinhibens]